MRIKNNREDRTYVFDSPEAESKAQQDEFEANNDLQIAKEFIAAFTLVQAFDAAEKVAARRWRFESDLSEKGREEWIEQRATEIVKQMINFIKEPFGMT